MQYLDNRVEFTALTVSFEPERPLSAAPRSDIWQPALTFQRALVFLGKAFAFLGDLLIWVGVVGVPFAGVVWGIGWFFKVLRRKRQTP